jgi:hypothetical protein
VASEPDQHRTRGNNRQQRHKPRMSTKRPKRNSAIANPNEIEICEPIYALTDLEIGPDQELRRLIKNEHK